MRKILALLMAAALCLGVLAACSDPAPSGTDATPPPAADPADLAAPAAPDDDPVQTLEPITFTFYSEDGSREQPWNTPIAQYITELTGVSLEFDYPVGGLGVRIPLMTASGDYPDLIYDKGDGAAQLMEAGAVINLKPYFDNSTYLTDFYGELLPRLWNNGNPDEIYSVGAYPIWQPVWNAQSAMPIQAEVLRELGYPNIRTVADAEAALREYIGKYPTIDGKPHYFFSLNNADGWRYIIDLGNPSGFLAGFPDDGEWIIDYNTLEASIKYTHPSIKQHYEWLNKLWNEGLIDPDSFTQTHDDWTAKMGNGQILATLSPQWMMNEPEQLLRQNGLEDRVYAHLPIGYDANVSAYGTFDVGWSGGWGVMISVDCKDPQRAFDFLDWCASEEGLVTRYWGIEGTHYTYENGIRVLIPEVKEALRSDPDYGNLQGFDWAYPFPEIGDGITDSTGSTFTRNTPESIIEAYTPANKEALAAYGATMWADLFPATADLPLSPFGAAWQIDIPTDSIINDKMQWVQNTWLPQELAKCVMAPPGTFDAQWEASQQLLYDQGVEELNSLFTDLVKAKAAAWGN